jgi:hypothetical protein
MSTLDTIVKDYDKNIVLRDCQRQAFEYLHDKKGDLLVTTFGTTFETLYLSFCPRAWVSIHF